MKKITYALALIIILLYVSMSFEEVQAEFLKGWHVVEEGPKYFEEGKFLTGMQHIGKTTYLFNWQGLKQTGWHRLNGKDYYFDANLNGGMVTGKRQIGNTTYLLHNNGYKTYGWHRLGGKDYYFDPNFGGGMVTGKRKIGNTTYLMHNDGHKTFGWHKLNSKEYYFDANYGGGMVTGKRKIGQTTYLMHNGGYKIYGWAHLSGKDYYFDPIYGGGMITGERRVGNTVYFFDKSGAKVKMILGTDPSKTIRQPITLSQFESFIKEINDNTYPFAKIYQPTGNTFKDVDIVIEGKIGMNRYFRDYQDIEWAYNLLMSYLSTTEYSYRGIDNYTDFVITLNLKKLRKN